MKAALLLGPENLIIGEAADPQPGSGQVVIEPAIAGVCGTDISFYAGRRIVPYPFILGHEVVGRIAAIGEGVSDLRIGQRVLVEPNYPCGACRLCLSGKGAVCAQKESMGVNVPGCYAEKVMAPAEFVWSLPDGISDEDAATIEPLAVSVHALLQSGARTGETIAVLGCGVVGLLLIHAAVESGIRVLAHDRLEGKLEMARALGATPVHGSEDAGRLWAERDVTTVFECAGAAATVELALTAAPRGSMVVLLGLSSSPVTFVPMKLVREGINVGASMIYDHPADFEYVIDRVAHGALHPAKVVTHTYPFAKLGEALAFAATGEAGKIHIQMK